MLPIIEDSAWPIVRATFRASITYEEIAAFGDKLREIIRKRGPIAVVGDISGIEVGSMTAVHRRLLAEQADALSAEHGIIAEAVVIPSAILRALFTGYMWARRTQHHQTEAFPNAHVAALWAEQQVQKAGPPKPRK